MWGVPSGIEVGSIVKWRNMAPFSISFHPYFHTCSMGGIVGGVGGVAGTHTWVNRME